MNIGQIVKLLVIAAALIGLFVVGRYVVRTYIMGKVVSTAVETVGSSRSMMYRK